MGNRSDPLLSEMVRRLSAAWREDSRTDGELLDRFARHRDHGAFAAIVGRHGRLVWEICRSKLVAEGDAEDAFQATFMALARKGIVLKGAESAGPWLRVTAGRAVLRVLRTSSRYGALRKRAPLPQPAREAEVDWTAIDEEVRRLPEELRRPLILHHFEGNTFAEIADRMGCSPATAHRRVSTAHDRLRERFALRGLAIPSLGIAFAALDPSTANASHPPESLLSGTASQSVAFAFDSPANSRAARVAAWLISPRYPYFPMAVAIALIATTAVAVSLAVERSKSARATSSEPVVPGELPTMVLADSKPLTTLTGQVRDARGRPTPQAKVSVLAHIIRRGEGGQFDEAISTATADAQGRFAVPVPDFPPDVVQTRRVKLLAVAPDGRSVAVSTVPIGKGEGSGRIDLTLGETRELRGRILDGSRRPVAGARVMLSRVAGIELAPQPTKDREPVSGIQDLQPTATSDGEGRFALLAVPSGGGSCRVAVEHERHAYQTFEISESRPGDGIDLELAPQRQLRGRVVAAGTGESVPFARLVAVDLNSGEAMGRNVVAGADGSFQFSAPVGRNLSVRVHPPQGVALLPINRTLAWPATQPFKDWIAELPSGMVVRGRVVEAETKLPVRHAQVRFQPERDETVRVDRQSSVLVGCSALCLADEEGRFKLVVPPERGHLLADGASLEYVTETTGRSVATQDGVYRVVDSAQARLALEVRPGEPIPEVTLELRTGRSLLAKVELPDGTPVPRASVVCRHFVNGRDLVHPVALPIVDGRMSIPGCRPGYSYTAIVVSADFEYGAAVRLPCRGGETIPTVRLEPTSNLSIDLDVAPGHGGPTAGLPATVTMDLDEEGPSDAPPPPCRTALPYHFAFADAYRALPKNARPNVDARGRTVFPGLIPGLRHNAWVATGTGKIAGYTLQPTAGDNVQLKIERKVPQ